MSSYVHVAYSMNQAEKNYYEFIAKMTGVVHFTWSVRC